MTARIQAKLDQPVCRLEGLSTWLLNTPGELAVVIHGDADCANVLAPGSGAAGLARFFCTGLSPERAAAGLGPQRLQSCLDLVCRQLRPVAVILLGSCVSALAGEDLEAAARAASRRAGVPVLCPPGPAMQFVGQVEVADSFAALMIGLCEPTAKTSASVNLLGFDPGPELSGLLSSAGVKINAVLDLGASLASWRAMAAAEWNLVVDGEMFERSLKDCAARLGQRWLELPYPVGSGASQGFLEDALAAILPDQPAPAEAALTRDLASRAVERVLTRTRGKRLGFNLGSLKNLEPASLARAGLLDLPAFEELGFETVLLLQGDDRPERLDAARRVLAGLGCAAPLAVFADTVDFGRLCRQQGCALVVAADYLGDQLADSGIGFLAHGSLRPGFAAVAENVELILAALARSGGS